LEAMVEQVKPEGISTQSTNALSNKSEKIARQVIKVPFSCKCGNKTGKSNNLLRYKIKPSSTLPLRVHAAMTKFREITSLSITSIEAPRQSDLLIELIKKLKPQVVVAGIAIF
jgi:hypothetical protein